MIMWVPPIWGQSFEAPSERAAPRASSYNHPSPESSRPDSAAARRQTEAFKLVRLENRGRGTAG